MIHFYINFCSGDQDSVIPLTGTRTLVNGLAKELGLDTVAPYRAWFEGRQVSQFPGMCLNKTIKSLTLSFLLLAFALQVAGWTQVYGDKLSFATIRGAAHEAPFSQPERSLVLFSAFLAGKPLPEELS